MFVTLSKKGDGSPSPFFISKIGRNIMLLYISLAVLLLLIIFYVIRKRKAEYNPDVDIAKNNATRMLSRYK